MLKTLPDALIFAYAERRGDLVQLTFKPNPSFRPSFHEAHVFHAMEGSMWVSSSEYRLSEINGHLTHEVKFGGGLLGHLDRGGHFHVQQEEVAPHYWELTLLNVDMRGKALFFKTISVEEKLQRSSFHRVPDDLTLAQVAQLLEKQIRAENKTKDQPSKPREKPVFPVRRSGNVPVRGDPLFAVGEIGVHDLPYLEHRDLVFAE